MIPESLFLTLYRSFDAVINKPLNNTGYGVLNFIFRINSSCEVSLSKFCSFLILEISLSASISIGTSDTAAVANSLEPVSVLRSIGAQYFSNIFSIMFIAVPLPVPFAPYRYKNFSILSILPHSKAPSAHKIFSNSLSAYNTDINSSKAGVGISVGVYDNWYVE